MWDHTDSVTCYPTQVNTPRLNSSQTGWYSIYLPRREVDLGDWLHTEMVYPPIQVLTRQCTPENKLATC